MRRPGVNAWGRRKWGPLGAGLVLAALLALVGAALAAAPPATGPRTVAVRAASPSPAPSAPPAEVVASIEGRLVVLSSDDGHVVRTLAASPAVPGPVTSVATTPDGLTVYFTVGEQCGGTRPQLFRVAAAGGAPERVADVGMNPAVSPDGHLLAYATSGVPEPGDCGPFDTLTVRDLTNGIFYLLDFGQSVGTIAPLAWTPDSTQIATAGWFAQTPGAGTQLVNWSPTGLSVDTGASARPGIGFTLAGNGYAILPSGEPITAFPTNTSSRVATFDPRTGDERRTLVEVPRPLYLVAADPPGRAFLFLGPLADTPDGHDLYRAAVDDPTPVRLAAHVTASAWLDTPAPPPPTTTTPAPPTTTVAPVPSTTAAARQPAGARQIVAWTDDFELQVLDAGTGRVVRVLDRDVADVRGLPTMAVTPDGSTVYYSRSRAPRPGECDAGLVDEIARVPVAGGAVESVTVGDHPAISPDGLLLAYARSTASPCATDRDELVVRDLVTGAERAWRSTGAQSIDLGGLSWARDSARLGFYEAADVVSPTALLLDTATGTSLDDAVAIPHDTGVEWVGFLGTTGRSIGVVGGYPGAPAPTRVVTFDSATGSDVRGLFTLPAALAMGYALPGSVQSDASGRAILVTGPPLPGGSGRGVLFRSDAADPAPLPLAEGVDRAVWAE